MQSKLCDILFAKGLNDRYSEKGISACVVDPGLVKTDIGTKAGSIVKLVWRFRKPFGVHPSISAKTYAWLCKHEDMPEALCYYNWEPQKYSREITKQNADRLFELSYRLCEREEGLV